MKEKIIGDQMGLKTAGLLLTEPRFGVELCLLEWNYASGLKAASIFIQNLFTYLSNIVAIVARVHDASASSIRVLI